MKLSYKGLALDELGEFTIAQTREVEEGQRWKVTLKVALQMFDRQYSDNYAKAREALDALRYQNGVLNWSNEETGETYINQTVTLLTAELPEEWGEYQQTLNLTFWYYDNNLTTNNLPLTFAPDTTGMVVTLGNVTRWRETWDESRFSPWHSERSMVKGRVTVGGLLLADPTIPLPDRRTQLNAKLAELKAAMNCKDGLLTYGVADGSGPVVFGGVVRVEEFNADVDQEIYEIRWSFTASYTVMPDEATFATVELDVVQRDPNTGEQFLTVSGKVSAKTEVTARTKLGLVLPVVLAQYGYGATAQELRNESSAKQVVSPESRQSPATSDQPAPIRPGGGVASPEEATADPEDVPDVFVELSFTYEFRKWRTDNQVATFKRTGSPAGPVSFGNVNLWDLAYSSRRFNEQRSQRAYAGGHISASGVWSVDRTLPVATRRARLLAQQQLMTAEVNNADGTLVYGDMTQVVRIENLQAHINQALTGIEWTFSAHYSLFPDEAGYATVEFRVSQNSSVETGDESLNFTGRILATDEALARAKLATLRDSMLLAYDYNEAQELRKESTSTQIFANGDKTAGLEESEAADGTTFIELAFTEEYRRRRADLVSWQMQSSSKEDVTTGLVLTTFTGYVIASGASADAAYGVALKVAQSLGGQAQGQMGANAFQRSAQVTWDKRQTQATNIVEFVRLSFSFEYQGKLAAGRAYIEVNVEVSKETFGVDSESVSGHVVAADAATAMAIYQAQVKAAYAGRMITGERTAVASVKTQKSGTATTMGVVPQFPPLPPFGGGSFISGGGGDDTYITQELRLDFGFSVYRPKATGTLAYRYAISTSRDFLNLITNTRVEGSVFAVSDTAAAAGAAALVATLNVGKLVQSSTRVDRQFVSGSTDVFTKMDFEYAFTDRLTGIAGVLEMRLTESVNFSGPRWVEQAIPRNEGGTGGISIMQDSGVTPGHRVIRGSVTAADVVVARSWARRQRVLLTGDKDGNNHRLPEQMEIDYEFVPRLDGVATGSGQNVRLFRVGFVFAEALPNYPPDS